MLSVDDVTVKSPEVGGVLQIICSTAARRLNLDMMPAAKLF